MKTKIALAIGLVISQGGFAIELSPQLENSIRAAHPLIMSSKPLHNNDGDKLYAISINPFVVQEFTLSHEGRQLEADVNRKEKTSPGMILVVREFENKYPKAQISEVNSHVALEIVAWLPEMEIEKLSKEYYVISIKEMGEEDRLSPTVSVPDRSKSDSNLKASIHDTVLPGGEIKSWAFARMQAPASTSSTPMYLIDGQLEEKVGASWVNMYSTVLAPVEPLNFNAYKPILPYIGGGSYHSTGIVSLIGAAQNGQLAVGMNPGQSMRLYGMGVGTFTWYDSTTNESQALDQAFADAEQRGEYATLSMSFNAYYGPSEYQSNFNQSSLAALGYYGKKFRVASNRFFVTQSAGNKGAQAYPLVPSNACGYAYHRDHAYAENDAIMVVGAYGHDGSHSNITSMEGPCVEAWAPGLDISMSRAIAGVAEVWTENGTSFAAPLTSALAARYQGRPLQKDRYISRTFTGARNVTHQSIGTYNNLYKFYPLDISVSGASANLSTANYIKDQKFSLSSPAWNAGSGNGWVSVGWSTGPESIEGVRISLRSSDPGVEPDVATNGKCALNGQPFITDCYPGVLHISVFAWKNGQWGLERHIIEYKQTNGGPIYIPTPGYTNVEGVLVWGDNETSWFSIGELEVYANN